MMLSLIFALLENDEQQDEIKIVYAFPTSDNMIAANMSTYLSEDVKKDNFTLNDIAASEMEWDSIDPIVYLTFKGQNVFEGTLKYIQPENSSSKNIEHDMTKFPEDSEE